MHAQKNNFEISPLVLTDSDKLTEHKKDLFKNSIQAIISTTHNTSSCMKYCWDYPILVIGSKAKPLFSFATNVCTYYLVKLV